MQAPRGFSYADDEETARRVATARSAVPEVYIFDAMAAENAERMIREAFGNARADIAYNLTGQTPTLSDDAIMDAFLSRLGFTLESANVAPLMANEFDVTSETAVLQMVGTAYESYLISQVDEVPARRFSVLIQDDMNPSERVVEDVSAVKTVSSAHQDIQKSSTDPLSRALATVSIKVVRGNLRLSRDETARRRQIAARAVPEVRRFVQKGTLLFLRGQVLTAQHVTQYQTLQSQKTPNVALRIFSVSVLLALFFSVLLQFGVRHIPKFSAQRRDLVSTAILFLGVGVISRVLVVVSDDVSQMIGYGCEPSAVWFLAPVAGGAMLVRLLSGAMWSFVFTFGSALLCTLLMDMHLIYFMYFCASGVAGASAVHHTRERVAILRAGLNIAGIGSAVALFATLIAEFVLDGGAAQGGGLAPIWAALFGFGGGLASALFVLAMMPLFENLGFVTDYRMMELASLNHPLMKQLMLRAPGSYHHSIVVGTLAEAACDAVGANSLQAKVSAYFHDIGKAMKPQYFIENNRDGKSRHSGLDPHTSAQIIIQHVVDGVALANEHRLPKPIVDNILMHHGDGLLQYFYRQAVEEASDPGEVDIQQFRYPGPRPDSREAGIIMLADKVEAATRTIVEPNEEKFRRMITSIINSVLNDGQFQNCPLTFQEIYTVGDAFVGVLMGIHHQRIEYPHTAGLSRGAIEPSPRAKDRVITLDIPGSEASAQHADDDARTDYESVEHLPRG